MSVERASASDLVAGDVIWLRADMRRVESAETQMTPQHDFHMGPLPAEPMVHLKYGPDWRDLALLDPQEIVLRLAARASDAPPNEASHEWTICRDCMEAWPTDEDADMRCDCEQDHRFAVREVAAAPSPNVRERELEAWASVGRSGACVHSSFNEDCAGCKLREANRAVRQLGDALRGVKLLIESREGEWIREILARVNAALST